MKFLTYALAVVGFAASAQSALSAVNKHRLHSRSPEVHKTGTYLKRSTNETLPDTFMDLYGNAAVCLTTNNGWALRDFPSMDGWGGFERTVLSTFPAAQPKKSYIYMFTCLDVNECVNLDDFFKGDGWRTDFHDFNRSMIEDNMPQLSHWCKLYQNNGCQGDGKNLVDTYNKDKIILRDPVYMKCGPMCLMDGTDENCRGFDWETSPAGNNGGEYQDEDEVPGREPTALSTAGFLNTDFPSSYYVPTKTATARYPTVPTNGPVPSDDKYVAPDQEEESQNPEESGVPGEDELFDEELADLSTTGFIDTVFPSAHVPAATAAGVPSNQEEESDDINVATTGVPQTGNVVFAYDSTVAFTFKPASATVVSSGFVTAVQPNSPVNTQDEFDIEGF